jgi:hypothetical protein
VKKSFEGDREPNQKEGIEKTQTKTGGLDYKYFGDTFFEPVFSRELFPSKNAVMKYLQINSHQLVLKLPF